MNRPAIMTIEEAAHILHTARGTSLDDLFGLQHARVEVRLAKSTDKLMAEAKSRAPDPDVLDDHPPFFLEANISNNKPDAYNTRMHDSSLKNYAADATTGVAFLTGHMHDAVPVGGSLEGRFTGGKNARVAADFYIPSNMKYIGPSGGEINSDSVIGPIRMGTLRDVSIGFYNGDYRCSLCGGDMLDWWGDCYHVPGVAYVKDSDKKGNEFWRRAKDDEEGETAYAWIHNARLAEVSGVFDGATPDAFITGVKAFRELEAGRMRPETVRLLEQRYRIKIIGGRSYPSAATNGGEMATKARETPKPGDEDQDDQEQGEAAGTGTGAAGAGDAGTGAGTGDAGQTEQSGEQGEQGGDEAARVTGVVVGGRSLTTAALRTLLKNAGAPQGTNDLQWLADELERLRPLADDGAAFRADLIERALREGARAFGERFDVEQRTARLNKLSTDEIAEQLDAWTEIARAKYPGGRASEEGETETVPSREPGVKAAYGEIKVPDRVYRA